MVIADLNEDLGNELAKKLECGFFKTNVVDEKNVQGLLKFAIEKYKRVHVVVNCAGIISAGTHLLQRSCIV